MSVFMKSLGFEVWQTVETGWSILTKTNNGKLVIEPTSKWSCEENRASSSNSTAPYAIQCGMERSSDSLPLQKLQRKHGILSRKYLRD